MTKPQRIQMKRTKGFNLQEYSKSINGLECVVVSRPTMWGNPFKLIGDMVFVDAGHRRKILDKWVLYYQGGGHTNDGVVNLYKKGIMGNPMWYEENPELKKRFNIMIERVEDLRGKNLACWCAPGVYCHADELLYFANKKKV